MIFEFNVTFAVSGVAARLTLFADTDNTATKASCVTVTICDATPVAEMVTFAVRVAPVFAEAVMVTAVA